MASAVIGKFTRLTVLLLLFVLTLVVSAEQSVPTGKAIPGSALADKQGALCVKPTEWMRRNHMELILHQRDMTVHQGIRIKDDSLSNCVECHARYDENKQPVAINSEGEFCSGCHSYTAVNLTCFQCHSTVPDTETVQR
jgi:hypothetical protein